MNNAAVKVLVNKSFFNEHFLNKDCIKINVKYTDKKKANGVVIPLSNEIILDDSGDDYAITLVGFWYEDECNFGTKELPFIIKINGKQYNELSNKLIEFNNIDRFLRRDESDFSVLCKLFENYSWFEILKDSLNKEFEYSKFAEFGELDLNDIGIYCFLTKIDK